MGKERDRKAKGRRRSSSSSSSSAPRRRSRSGKRRSRSRDRKAKSRSRSAPRRGGRDKEREPAKAKGRRSSSSPSSKRPAKGGKAGGKGGGQRPSPSPPRAARGSPSPARGGRASPSPLNAEARPGSDDGSDKEPEKPAAVRTDVTLTAKPFGMAPSKEPGLAGYVVAKVAEGKPAAAAGVECGWRVVAVAGADCKDMDFDAVQALLKDAALPAKVTFERPAPAAADEGDDDEEEFDILDQRADMREKNAEAMASIDDLPVKRSPEGLPPPISSWQDACGRSLLNKPLADKLVAAGLRRPTLIQRHALPIVGHESGKHDLVAMAQTGSGKTFAFVIPTVGRLLLQGVAPRPFFPGKSPGCPLLLVLSPTRELAMQTNKEIEVLARGTKLSSVTVYGGETLKFQQQRIEKTQIDILCATPGRLIDLIDAGKISLSFIQSVVLDEADQMLEQSLEVMCAEILTGRDMPEPGSGRQTLLFSATMPQKIRDMCPRILRQEALANLTIGNYSSNQGGTCASIKQILKWVPDESVRFHALVDDLRRLWIGTGKNGRVVVFTNQRVQAGHLAKHLEKEGFAVVHLHGKLDQSVREEVFNSFRKGESDILIATNVASRGLDFPDIKFVVQFNLPNEIDIYTHRIGRTGRVGQVGCALAYIGPKDRHLRPRLVDFLQLNKQEVPDFLRDDARGRPRDRDSHHRNDRSRW